jgi:DNA-binding CsgD family transcriptional regulator/tetratricopeptide (TPR) repeat protein
VAGAPAERLRAEVGARDATLATILPEIPARLGPPASGYPLGPEQERFRLYEAVSAFLGAIAARGPVALLLDDLQWADAATLDLLVHLAARLRAAAVLVVGAYREGEAEANPPLIRALAELNRRRLLITLPLQPLDAEGSQRLTAGVLGGAPAPEVADLLHRHGEGNPFFLEELLRSLVEQGALVRRGRRWELVERPPLLLPPQVAEAIRLRLARLTPAVVETLRVAAVVGRACDPRLLAGVVGTDAERVEEWLQAAVRAHVVQPDADGAYAFVHDMVRETLYAEVGGARRRRLHQAIGEALEAQGDAGSPRRLVDLAFHFAQAGDTARGLSYALACGARALRASAPAEALGHYRTALALLGPDGDGAQRALTLMGLGDAATLGGDYEQAAAAYEGAQAAWLMRGDRAAAARAWRLLGRVRWRQEAVAGARAAFERALELLGAADGVEAAETLLHLADLHATSLGRYASGLAYAARALAMVKRLGEQRLEAAACRVLGTIKARGGELDCGRAMLERALALAQALDDPALAAEACADLATVCAWGADAERAIEVSALRAALAQRTQDLYHLRDVYAWIGLQEALRGHWTAAEQHFAQQERIVDGLRSPEPRASLGLYRGILRYFQGRFAEAEPELRDVVQRLRPTGGTLVWCLGWWGQVLTELGRRDEALDCFAELRALAEATDERSRARGNAFAQLAVGYARLGEAQRAADCYAPLLPFQGQVSPVLIDRGLGAAALAGGDVAAARAHLADAEALARRAGMRPELALALLQRGLLEGTGGAGARAPSAPAGDPLAEGLRLCAELGMQAFGRRMLSPVPAARAAAGAAGAGRRREPRVAGLSDRELEVLRLVAAGRTNREIAAVLVLSENTVARHLTHIFTKMGVGNRAGATAFALRHGLA